MPAHQVRVSIRSEATARLDYRRSPQGVLSRRLRAEDRDRLGARVTAARVDGKQRHLEATRSDTARVEMHRARGAAGVRIHASARGAKR